MIKTIVIVGSLDHVAYARKSPESERMNRSSLKITIASMSLCCIGLSTSCSSVTQRAWSSLTHTTFDDDQPRLARSLLEKQREGALEHKTGYALSKYGGTLYKFLWEAELLFDARAAAAADPAAKYREPKLIAGIDREALIAEFEAEVAAVEAVEGYMPLGRHYVDIMRKDCAAVVREATLYSSCSSTGEGLEEAISVAVAACGEPQTFCRALTDVIADPERRYFAMGDCAQQIGGELIPALQTWATADEIEAHIAMGEEIDRVFAKRDYQQKIANANAAQENDRRQQQYNDDRAAYADAQGPIESVSGIGHLDPADGPPARPEMVKGTIALRDSNYVGVSDQAIAVVRNQCDRPITFGRAKPGDASAILDPISVGPGEVGDIELSRCEGARLEVLDGSRESWWTTAMVEGMVFDEDCESMRRMSPEELVALGFDLNGTAPKATAPDAPAPE